MQGNNRIIFCSQLVCMMVTLESHYHDLSKNRATSVIDFSAEWTACIGK